MLSVEVVAQLLMLALAPGSVTPARCFRTPVFRVELIPPEPQRAPLSSVSSSSSVVVFAL